MRFIAVTILCALTAAPAHAGADGAVEKIRTFVSIPPQTEFVGRVGGDLVDVELLLEPGQNPHAFDPSPRKLARLGDADLFFAAGLPYERELTPRLRDLFRGLRIVDTRRGIELRRIDGERDGHGHGGADPHFWLDPERVKTAAGNICEALVDARPEHGRYFRANLAAYRDSLDELDRRIAAILRPHEGRRAYVYHPAFGYFFDACGIDQQAVQTAGRQPSARELAAVVDRMRADGARVMFVQPEFPAPVAATLRRSLDVDIVRLDPLAADYSANLLRMARAVADAFSTDGSR